VTQAEAKEHKAFAVYLDVSTKGVTVLRGLVAAFEKSAKDAGQVKMLGAPAWLRSLSSMARSKSETYDPKEAGRRIAEALNATAPSFLLLNDLHNLAESGEVEVFAKTLEEVTGAIKPGVLVMIACYASYLAWLTANQPALASRVNRTIPLMTLSDDEARLLLAKKLLAKRIVEDLEPTYPFDREAVQELNRASRGNPRRLISLADIVLERAVTARAYQIDGELVRATLATRVLVEPGPAPVWQEAPSVDEGSSPTTTPPADAAPARRSFFGRKR